MGESELAFIQKLFEDRFNRFELNVKEDINKLENTIAAMADRMVPRDRFESKMHNVKQLQEMVHAQEKRINKVEAFIKGFTTVLKWGLGIFTALVIGVGIAALTGFLKL